MAAFEDVETFAFQSEIAQLMSHVANTSYSKKEIFLRELVSNSSNALDKIRHESISNSSALKSGRDFCIKIIPDTEKNTLTIIDTGIGMTKSDLVNLGTIANSGTKAFLGILKSNVDANMIGQIGIGFYSVYLVANKVTIVSKHNSDKQYTWESVVGGSFTIRSGPGEPLGRGTKIVLHINENRTEFLQQEKIASIIKKHSQFVCYPIKLVIENIQIKEVSDNEAEDEGSDNEYVEKNKKKKKIVKEKFFVQQVLNKTKPIWTCNLDEISQDEFSDLYKFLTNDWETYLAVKHICLDGKFTFQALLFVPNQAPLDMYEKKNNIHIYICHVFIMDNCEDIMPEYLSFIKGILDTQSLPLNISREKFQQSNILKVIRRILVTKCFEMFNDLAKDKVKYMTFYKQFSKNLKIGIHQDSDNKKKLFNLLRYYTSLSGNEACSLKDYVTRMKQNQTQIYYITGENRNQVANSVFIERLKKCGYEVIYMTEPLDEYVLDLMEKFEGKDLASAAKEGLDLPETDEEKIKRKNDQTEFEQFCKFVKEILGKKVENVVISNRLVESPCCIVTQKHGWTANLERIMKAEALHSMPTESQIVSKKILEINPDNQIINKLKQKIEANSNDKAVRDLIIFLFETSLMSSGFELRDPHFITSKIHKLIAFGLNIGEDLPVIEERFTNVEPTPVEHDAENIPCMEELD